MKSSLRPILAALGVALFVASAQADIPKLISIQGRLTDSTGTPLDSTVSLTVTVYGDAAGTSVLFTEDHPAVTVADGLFNLLVGSVSTLPDSVYRGAPRWMGIGFTGGASIQSPLPVASVAYAIKSGTADTAGYALSAPSGAGGWTDDGAIVRLSLVDDSVGIGTDSPQTKLHIIGDLRVEGKALIGVASDNPGNYAFAAGESNLASGNHSTVAGGQNNVAESDYATVGGGILDSATALCATVSGGLQNRAAGSGSVVGGGAYNDAEGSLCTIAGGTHNLAIGPSAAIAGGDSNSAYGAYSGALSGISNRAGVSTSDTGNVVAGGFKNSTQNPYTSVGGGRENQAIGYYSQVAGGYMNFAAGEGNTIGGGRTNTTDNDFATIGGGINNYAEANCATISGGGGNWVGSQYSTIAGGRNHFLASAYSTIPGGYADTVAGTAHYSYLFGIGSKLTQDSTFMVDMPHFWIGKEATGWQLTNSRGTSGQVLTSNGAGGSSWQNAPIGGGGWTDDGTVVRLQTSSDKVGIGTYSPRTALDVQGVARVMGDTWPTAGEGLELAYDPANNLGLIQVFNRGDYSWGTLYLGEGKVGIGTVTPLAKLHIISNANAITCVADGVGAQGVWAKSINTGGMGIFGQATGTNGIGVVGRGGPGGLAAKFYGNVLLANPATGATVLEMGEGLDYAEGFAVTNPDAVEPGIVLIIDPDHPGQLTVSHLPYDTRVAGIVAGADGLGSGVRLGGDGFDHDVALAGRVYCNVETSSGQIKPGDMLTSSSIPGYAMKVSDFDRARGAVLGKAMESMAPGSRGRILVLVTLQ